MTTLFNKVQAFDERFVRISSQLNFGPFLTKILLFITYTGYGHGWLTLLAVIHILEYNQMELFHQQLLLHECMIGALIAWGSGYAVKKIAKRKRPYEIVEGHTAKYKTRLHDPSFPSNHTAAAVAFFVCLLLTGHVYAPYIAIWAVLVAFSRFYLGVHFISDICGGVVLGIASGLIGLLAISAHLS